MGDIQQTFRDVVARMLDTDNTKRQEAEKQYEDIALADKIALLWQLYANKEQGDEVRSLCLVLTRRLVDNNFEEVWTALGANKTAYVQQVLQGTIEEPRYPLQKKLADVIAQIALNEIDEDSGAQKSKEIIQFIEHCIQSDNVNLKKVVMSILESVPGVFGSDQAKYLGGIKQMFEACLASEDVHLRSHAIKAYTAFICDNDEDDKVIKQFSGLIPHCIKVCEHVVSTQEDDDQPVQCLSDLVATIPKTLTPYLDQLLQFCFATVGNADTEDGYRSSALEVVTSLCESAPNMVKKRAAGSIPAILQCCLQMMTELDDDIEEWLAVDDAEQDLEEDNPAAGETSLDRIACALGGKAVLQPFLQVLHTLLKNADWKKRYAGVMGVSTIGEGCQRQMEPLVVELVNELIPLLNDEHPRVQYAVCNALGQMSTDFAPTLQKRCHEKVVPSLISTLMAMKYHRVSAHAGAALVNFSEDCPKNVISMYLQGIMQALEQVLENTFKQMLEKGRKLVLEQVITTIASVADAAQEHFIQYYDRLIAPLKYILQNAVGEEFRLLRGKTIECISLIGLAVGREKFASDATEIMGMLSDVMPNLSPDDPQCSYMISSWTRICKVLGPLFAPYLPMVMPSIIRAMEYNPDVQVVDDDEVEEDPSWTFHSVGDNKSFGIRTSGIEEKATACEMLVCYARELKEHFAVYVEQVMPIVQKNLKFIFHEGVRVAAAEVIPCLIESVKNAGGVPAMRKIWEFFFPQLLECLHTEIDVEASAEFINSIAESIEVLGTEGVTAEEVGKIGEVIKEGLDGHFERLKEKEAQEVDEDADPEDVNEIDAEDEDEYAVVSRISDLVHSGFKTFGDAFYPVVEPHVEQMVSLMDPSREYMDRQWGICMIDDIIEFAPERAVHLQQHFLPAFLHALKDKYPEVRQAAAYGFGAMAVKGTSVFAQTCVSVLPHLAEMIADKAARSTEEHSVATENAIAAVAKILKFCGGAVPIDQSVIPAFLSWLPTYHDKEESVHIYGYLADLVESNNPLALGENNSNLSRVLSVIIDAFHNDAFEGEYEGSEAVRLRLVNIVKALQQNGELFQACVQNANLDDGKRETLAKILA